MGDMELETGILFILMDSAPGTLGLNDLFQRLKALGYLPRDATKRAMNQTLERLRKQGHIVRHEGNPPSFQYLMPTRV